MYKHKPDFWNLKNHLMVREKGSIPIIELLIANEIKENVTSFEFPWVVVFYYYLALKSCLLQKSKNA